jgi:hypothetical protein
MKTRRILTFFLACGACCSAAEDFSSLPPRPSNALTGTQFAAFIAKMDSGQRESAVLTQLLEGNFPNFLRHLVPVQLNYPQNGAKAITATVYVMPEYLAIGSDKDYLRIPMNLYTAIRIATQFGCVLPTRKMVDAIYQQSAFHFAPEPMTAGPQMRSTQYYLTHNQKIEEQARKLGIAIGELVSGDKKDIVMTNLLASKPGQIAIYGWHRLTGAPIQPLSTVHGACYEDYSHGVRLVSQTAVVDGQRQSIEDVLRNPRLANVLSDEGLMGSLQTLLARSNVSNSCSH